MAAKKKAAKKAVKKAVKKTVEKKGKAFSVVVCEYITEGKLSKEQIATKIAKEYPGVKFNGMKAVMYYMNFITLGKMRRAGFEPDSIPDSLRKEVVKKTEPEEKTTTFDAKKKAVKKVAKKKVAKKAAKRKS